MIDHVSRGPSDLGRGASFRDAVLMMLARARWLLAVALLGCGSPPSAPTPPAPVPAPTSIDPPAPPPPLLTSVPAEAEAPTEALAVAPPPTLEAPVAPVALPDTGLPPVSTGPAIRLELLPVTMREVDGRHIPSVTLADPTAQANLDAWFTEHAWCRGRVELAIEGFVSYACTYDEPAAGGGSARAAMNVRIAESGEVEELHAADFFVAGTDVDAMVRVWADDPEAPLGEMSFGPSGAVIEPMVDSEDRLRLPWRTIAPYVRADGPLGPALVAHGLTLAPAGTSAPPAPLATTALIFSDAGMAMAAAARLPAGVRAGTRLRVGPEESVLLLPPGTDRATLEVSGRGGRRYEYGALAELVSVRVEGAVEIHESAGPRTPVNGALPTGAAAVAARGPIGARTSELGTGWVLIAGAGGRGGYVPGRGVAESDGCGAPAGSPGGIGGYAELAPDERLAWTLTPRGDGARTEVALFPVGADCAIGAEVRRASVEGAVTDLRVVRATADGPDWLLVVVTAADLALSARTVAVFGPEREAPPLYSATVDAPVVRLAERRGPDHAPGYFPITISSGDARTWLSWNGSTIEALVAAE